MRKALFITLLLIGSNANAQMFLRGDATIGSAFTIGNLKSYGISTGYEPKLFFNENISVGLRAEGAVMFGGKIAGESEDIKVQMSSRAAYLLKGEYYIGGGDTKPFVGLMAGYYTQANIGAGGNGSASIGASRNFGFAPEIGVTFGNFRISGMYHIVGGSEIVTLSSGEEKRIPHSYFVVTLGFKTFQLDF